MISLESAGFDRDTSNRFYLVRVERLLVHLDKEEEIRSGQGRLTQLERGAIWSIIVPPWNDAYRLPVFLQEILLYERIDGSR